MSSRPVEEPIVDRPLWRCLERSRDYGYLGPGPLEVHVDHALGFASVVEGRRDPRAFRAVDLGSGGGVPGLVLLRRWPESSWCFLDTNQRRMQTLENSLAELDAADRSRVVCSRAEEAVRQPDLRETFDLVVARGFSAPAVTAECAAPLLRVGGMLVVSEPPNDEGRWNADVLAELGLRGSRVTAGSAAYFVADQTHRCPDKYPRRVGVPGKRPLF